MSKQPVRVSPPNAVISKPLAIGSGDTLVVFTPFQLKFIADKAKGLNPRNGSTHSEVTRKIRLGTGWDGSGVALFSRFAFKHGLVKP